MRQVSVGGRVARLGVMGVAFGAAGAALGLLGGCAGALSVPGGAGSSSAASAPAAVAIEVNQVGYLPGGAKWALVHGDVAAAVAAAGAFRVVDLGSGQVVWRGQAGPVRDWDAAQQPVRLLDFSALQTVGRYRVEADTVAGAAGAGTGAAPATVQASPGFVIGSDVYAGLSAAAVRAFYYQRASTALPAAFAGEWARDAGHPDTEVRVHASAAGPLRPAGAIIAAPKGWYDAGDYNKYIVNSGISTWTLLAAWEHFPAFFRAQAVHLPESGQGLPDLLAEAQWNLDWMLAMQDPADGGVYAKLTDLSFDGAVMPAKARQPRYVVQKTTAAALDFAAVMATASRVYAPFDAQQPGRAARMLAAARQAWAWADAHPAVVYRQPPDVHTGGYGDEALADEFAWAAAELYISTREDGFWQRFAAGQPGIDVPGWGNVQSLGWVSLAHHRARLTPAADPGLIAARIRSETQRLAQAWAASAGGLAMQVGDFNWGSNAVALNQALMLTQGVRLDGPGSEQGHALAAAQAALDHVLGRNPLGRSQVTGQGARPPLYPHHRPSMAAEPGRPVPGFVVGGPNPGRQDAANCPVAYASAAPARAWLDHTCSYASNEVAINWNAPLVYVSAALATLTGTP